MLVKLGWTILFCTFLLSTSSLMAQELDLGADLIDLSKSNLADRQRKPKATSASFQKSHITDIETTSALNFLCSEANKLGHHVRPSELYTTWANYVVHLKHAYLDQRGVFRQPDGSQEGYREENWVADLLRAHATQKLSKKAETSMLKALSWRECLIATCGESAVTKTEKSLRKPLKPSDDFGAARTTVQKYSTGYTSNAKENSKESKGYVGDFDHGLYIRHGWKAE